MATAETGHETASFRVLQVHEGLFTPRPPVAVVGLETDKNTHHATIWDTLSRVRSLDKSPFVYIQTTADNAFPPRKEKPERQLGITEEDYTPPGIFKTNWMPKHMERIPSVVVVFYDLDWEDPNWDDEQTKCAQLVAQLRANSAGRGTRLLLVLLQTKTLPDGDPFRDSRAVSIRKACNLNTRGSLFVLNTTDDSLSSVALRLEGAFSELSKQHYHAEIERVQKHLDIVNRATELTLVIRYSFKLGFLYEMAQQRKEALREYRQALATVKRMDPVPEIAFEIKSVATLITAKMCRLFFLTQAPRDAVTAFREICRYYRHTFGPQSESFLHHLWLAEVHLHFALIFEEAVAAGLVAVPSEHPGFYFQAASHNLRSLRLALDALDATEPLGFAGELPEQVYVGQLIPKDTEADRIEMLRARFASAPFDAEDLRLLDAAKRHFQPFDKKPPGQSRLMTNLELRRAAALVSLGKFQEPFTLLKPAIVLYRHDGWLSLLRQALKLQAKCAHTLVERAELVQVCLQLASDCLGLELEERTLNQSNFIQAISSSPDMDNDDPSLQERWKSVPTEAIDFDIDMNSIHGCVEAKVLFLTDADNNRPPQLRVAMLSKLPMPLSAADVAVSLAAMPQASAGTNQESAGPLSASCQRASQSPIILVPGTVKVVDLEVSVVAAGPIMLQCQSLSLIIQPTAKAPRARLNWAFPKLRQKAIVSNKSRIVQLHRRLGGARHDYPVKVFSQLPVLNAIEVHPEEGPLAVTASVPKEVLVNERIAIELNVSNRGKTAIHDAVISLSVVGHATGPLSGVLSMDGVTEPLNAAEIHIGNLEPGQEQTLESVTLTMPAAGVAAHLECRSRYKTGDQAQPTHSMTTGDDFVTSAPFTVSWSFSSAEHAGESTSQNVSIDRLDDCVLEVQVTNSSSATLELLKHNLECGHGLSAVPPIKVPPPPALLPGETAAVLFVLSLSPVSESDTHDTADRLLLDPRGVEQLLASSEALDVKLMLSWKRQASRLDCSTTYALPPVMRKHQAIVPSLSIPSVARLGQPMEGQLRITNTTPLTQEFELFVESSDAFRISGYQRARRRVLPAEFPATESHIELTFVLVPTKAGTCLLPKISVTDCKTGAEVRVRGPRSAFVHPAAAEDLSLR